MEEVRSYWQVAGISHFCTLFGKQFNLPQFEPEELEQAFILDVPHNQKDDKSNPTTLDDFTTSFNRQTPSIPEEEQDEEEKEMVEPTKLEDDPDYEPKQTSSAGMQSIYPTDSLINSTNSSSHNSVNSNNNNNQQNQQQDEHLLVRLAIRLLKPHFSSKITQHNWENYLLRIIETNWVGLEQYPSPFKIPILSQDGAELTKNLTFNELPLSDKIDLFYALCDYRLWCDDVADAIKDYTLEDLRHESLGKDSQGYEYWYFSGTRLYRENRDLSQDVANRSKRIKELEFNIIELEKERACKEQEEIKKQELERARQLAIEAKEAARLALKKQQEQEATSKSRRQKSIPVLPPRTGLRERRSSAASNNNLTQQASMVSTRTKLVRQCQTQRQQEAEQQRRSTKKTRGSSKNGTNGRRDILESPDLPRKQPLEECKEELEQIKVTSELRAESWMLHCESLEDWEKFAASFEKTKSTNEKYLSANINEYILPKIRAIYAKRAAEARRKEKEIMFTFASRRTSSRIIEKKVQEEEEHRKAVLHEAEVRKRKMEAEGRLRAELEHEMRARKKQMLSNGGASSTCSDEADLGGGRYNLRQQHNPQTSEGEDYMFTDEFDGIVHPDKLSEFYEALELVVDSTRTSKHASPFVDPVPRDVDGYYDLIEHPMDLRKLRAKVQFREYKSLVELEKDFQLIVNNCERFNGPKSVYTKMSYKLWKSFRKNVRLFLMKNLTMDEQETFIYPPPPPPPPQMVSSTQLAQDVISPHSGPSLSSHECRPPAMNSISEKIGQEVSMEESQQSSEDSCQSEDSESCHSSDLDEPKAPTPEPISEEIVYDFPVDCPDDSVFIWPSDNDAEKSKGQAESQETPSESKLIMLEVSIPVSCPNTNHNETINPAKIENNHHREITPTPTQEPDQPPQKPLLTPMHDTVNGNNSSPQIDSIPTPEEPPKPILQELEPLTTSVQLSTMVPPQKTQ